MFLSFPSRVLRALEHIAPRRFADLSWDNVGILVDNVDPPERTHWTVALSLDLTTAVIRECVAKGVGVLVCYHPAIFPSIRELRADHPKSRAIILAARHGIAIVCPHTALDNCPEGINSWIAKGIMNHCFNSETVACADNIANISQKDPVYQLTYLDEDKQQGAKIQLNKPLIIQNLIEAMKAHFRVRVVRCAFGIGDFIKLNQIQSIGICAGSGSSVLRQHAGSIDCVVSGEMGHHDILHLQQMGTSVLLVEHETSERGYLSEVLLARLTTAIKETDHIGEKIEVITLNSDESMLVYK